MTLPFAPHAKTLVGVAAHTPVRLAVVLLVCAVHVPLPVELRIVPALPTAKYVKGPEPPLWTPYTPFSVCVVPLVCWLQVHETGPVEPAEHAVVMASAIPPPPPTAKMSPPLL